MRQAMQVADLRSTILGLCVGACLLIGSPCFATPSTLYSYDSTNHLVQATATTGAAVQYQYDLAGNVTGTTSVSPTAWNTSGQQNVAIGTAGQSALLTFNATAGESLDVNLGSITTTPVNTPVTVGVYDTSGNLVGSATSASGTSLDLDNLAGGTYTVIVTPNGGATGSLVASTTSSGPENDGGPSTDGPLPAWCYVVLAAALLWIGRRYGQRTLVQV